MSKYNGTHGPLPSKAQEYISLKKTIEKVDEMRKKEKMLDQMTGDERAGLIKNKNHTQKKSLLKKLEVELFSNMHIYRSSLHKLEVIAFLFPEYKFEVENNEQIEKKEEPKKEEKKEPKKEIVQQSKPVSSGDAWDNY